MQNLDSKIDAAVGLLSNLENAYQQKNTATKQHIVSSIFPSKLIFDNKKVRTLKMNRVISLICRNDKALKECKKSTPDLACFFVEWIRRDSNSRPNKEKISFLHV